MTLNQEAIDRAIQTCVAKVLTSYLLRASAHQKAGNLELVASEFRDLAASCETLAYMQRGAVPGQVAFATMDTGPRERLYDILASYGIAYLVERQFGE
jgi:hypothetical protein